MSRIFILLLLGLLGCATTKQKPNEVVSQSRLGKKERRVAKSTVTLDLQEADLRVAVRKLREATGLRVFVDSLVADRTVTMQLTDIPVIDALKIITAYAGARLQSFEKVGPDEDTEYWLRPGCALLTLSFPDISLRLLLKLLGAELERHYFVEPGLDCRVALEFRGQAHEKSGEARLLSAIQLGASKALLFIPLDRRRQSFYVTRL